MKIKIASRKSDLARWQSVLVSRVLKQDNPETQCEFIFKSSLGDQNLDVALSAMGGKGVFTEDFRADLLSGQCDMVVHSWKDLPVEVQSETQISMTLARADMRDLLLVPEVVWHNAVTTGRLEILTSSPRRIYNLKEDLKALLPAKLEVIFKEVRGNVPTRLTKMREQGCALLLAKAGLDRLLAAEAESFLECGFSLREVLKTVRFMVLPLQMNPPAAAQGALAVETMKSSLELNQVLAKLTDGSVERCVRREREILKGYGGGCHQKIGVAILERPFGAVVSIRGITDAGKVLNSWRIEQKDKVKWPRAQRPTDIFPSSPQENSWFERKTLSVSIPTNSGMLVARSEGLPHDFVAAPGQPIWTAGVRTWERLAARGYWVNGSAEGLGEEERPGLDFLMPEVKSWVKVSHDRSASAVGVELLPTYQLVEKDKEQSPDLRGKTHFFWMSTTSFERAKQLYPKVIEAGLHSCGPGSTYKALSRPGVLKQPPKIFIDFAEFLRETLPSPTN